MLENMISFKDESSWPSLHRVHCTPKNFVLLFTEPSGNASAFSRYIRSWPLTSKARYLYTNSFSEGRFVICKFTTPFPNGPSSFTESATGQKCGPPNAHIEMHHQMLSPTLIFLNARTGTTVRILFLSRFKMMPTLSASLVPTYSTLVLHML